MKRTLRTIKVAGFMVLAAMAFASCNNDEQDHDADHEGHEQHDDDHENHDH